MAVSYGDAVEIEATILLRPGVPPHDENSIREEVAPPGKALILAVQSAAGIIGQASEQGQLTSLVAGAGQCLYSRHPPPGGVQGEEVSTLQQASHFAKIASPFLAAIFSLVFAYVDRRGGWKFIVSILAALFFLGIGCVGILVHDGADPASY